MTRTKRKNWNSLARGGQFSVLAKKVNFYHENWGRNAPILENRTEIALASVTDSATGQTRKYYYDFLDRPVKYTEEGGTGLNSHAVLYT